MKKELRKIYRKNKKIIIPGVLFFAVFFIIVRVILPQIDSISEIQKNIEIKTSEIESSNNLFNTLSSMPDQELTNNYNIATKAVPIQKDLTIMFTALTDAATKANVVLGGFTLNAGGVYDSTNLYWGEKVIDGIPYLNVVVSVSGSENNLIKFGEALYKNLPLIQINSIQVREGRGSFDINFYFKPVIQQSAIKKEESIGSITPKEKALLKTLSEWQ